MEAGTYLEKVLGRSTAQERAREEGRDTGKWLTEGKPLMSADQIRMMGDKEAILVSGAHQPMFLNMPPFFRSWVMKRQAQKPPAQFQFNYKNEEVAYLDIE